MMFLVWSALLVAAAQGSALSPHQLQLKEHYEHLAYIAEFPCHVPQPRVIPSHHLFTPQESHGKAYFPDVTVLHRCDSAVGCCTGGEHCTPLHQDPVHLPFKITFMEDFPSHRKGSWVIEYFYFQNHTECGCSAVPDEHAPVHEQDKDNLVTSGTSPAQPPETFQPSATYPTTVPVEQGYEQQPEQTYEQTTSTSEKPGDYSDLESLLSST